MENQNKEWKEKWNDDYLKTICGFANADGGTILIGINNQGEILGLVDAKKLMEDIPNKTKDMLGILVDVNLKKKAKKNYIEIIVEPYPYPISYKGQYHYRSGSTKQELKGAALDKFILQKQGKRWDAVPLANFKSRDIYKKAIDQFKQRASKTNRVNIDVFNENIPVLLDKLNLKADATYYKRACGLLFYVNPEKYITGAYVKLGFFNTDDDLLFQDEVHGSLFEQVDQVMELLLVKYLKAKINYKGTQRIESYPIPIPALREALLNSIVHKDYSSHIPIQISVYANKLVIWNEAQLPENWTIDRLKVKHPSRPFNPDVANCFFRAGLIETWGRGTLKIMNECRVAKINIPQFTYDNNEFMIEFFINNTLSEQVVKIDMAVSLNEEKVMRLLKSDGTITIAELAKRAYLSESTIKRIIKKLQTNQQIYREGSDKDGAWKLA